MLEDIIQNRKFELHTMLKINQGDNVQKLQISSELFYFILTNDLILGRYTVQH